MVIVTEKKRTRRRGKHIRCEVITRGKEVERDGNMLKKSPRR